MFIIAGRQFRSRLIVGTGKYKSFQETARALEASGADMVTVAVRRVNLDRSKESLLDYIDPNKYFLLPNEEMPIHEEYRRRLIAASETDAEWYANLYELGWPDSPHRALHNSTAEMWEAAGEPPPGSRPGEGEAIAQLASGETILRYSPAAPMVGTTGEIEALSLWAGQSVVLAKQTQPAAEIVAELVSRL